MFGRGKVRIRYILALPRHRLVTLVVGTGGGVQLEGTVQKKASAGCTVAADDESPVALAWRPGKLLLRKFTALTY